MVSISAELIGGNLNSHKSPPSGAGLFFFRCLPTGWTGSKCCWLHFARANRFFLLLSTSFSDVGSRFP